MSHQPIAKRGSGLSDPAEYLLGSPSMHSRGGDGPSENLLNDFQINLDEDLIIGDEIGSGMFSKVYVGSHFGDLVAVKKQTMPTEDGDTIETALQRELTILAQVSHPNLIEYIGSAVQIDNSGRHVVIVTEYMEGGDLNQLVTDQSTSLGFRFRVGLALDAARGLADLHSKGIIHRDIKAANLLLGINKMYDHEEEGRAAMGGWCCKITDFGFARSVHNSTTTSNRERSEDIGEISRRMTICGTDKYMAPELQFDEEYGAAADVYSFGLVLVELWSRSEVAEEMGGFARAGPQTNFALDLEALKASAPTDVAQSFVELSVQCCAYEQEERVSMKDVVAWLEDLYAELPNDEVPPPPHPAVPQLPMLGRDSRAISTTQFKNAKPGRFSIMRDVMSRLNEDQDESVKPPEPPPAAELTEESVAEFMGRFQTVMQRAAQVGVVSEQQSEELRAIAMQVAKEPARSALTRLDSIDGATTFLKSQMAKAPQAAGEIRDSVLAVHAIDARFSNSTKSNKNRRMESWLHKKNHKWPRNWVKRYFVLEDTNLLWYRSVPTSSDDMASNTFNLIGSAVLVLKDNGAGLRLVIICPDGEFTEKRPNLRTALRHASSFAYGEKRSSVEPVPRSSRTLAYKPVKRSKPPKTLEIACQDKALAQRWLDALQVPMMQR